MTLDLTDPPQYFMIFGLAKKLIPDRLGACVFAQSFPPYCIMFMLSSSVTYCLPAFIISRTDGFIGTAQKSIIVVRTPFTQLNSCSLQDVCEVKNSA